MSFNRRSPRQAEGHGKKKVRSGSRSGSRPGSRSGAGKKSPVSAAELWSSSARETAKIRPRSYSAKPAVSGAERIIQGLEKGRKINGGLVLLYEDRDILIVYKPTGLLSIATETQNTRSAYSFLCDYLRQKGEKRRAAVVHRLDRDTSGILVFAKSERIKRLLMEAWDELVLERGYTAVIEGRLADDKGLISLSLGEDRGGRVIVDAQGKPARTRFKVTERFARYTLVSIVLETGRRNQIRVHFSAIGHPIAGDKKYGARSDPLGRLALHAGSLVFTHPADGAVMRVSVPADSAFSGVSVRSSN